MAAKVIDGKALATTVRQEFKRRTDSLIEAGVRPGLAVIRVGDNPASRAYVRNKTKACADVGIYSLLSEFAVNTPPDDILRHIHQLNADPAIHGGMVQHIICFFIDQ